jgi:hypothetical protein
VEEEPAAPDLAWLSRHSWAWDPARLRASGAIPIDATQPLGHVVDAILSHTLASSATSQASKRSNRPGAPARP